MIPNVVHFIYFNGPNSRDFSYLNYLAVRAAHDIQQPDTIYMHYNTEPVGNPNWDRMKSYVTLAQITPPERLMGVKLGYVQYQADVVRLQKLLEHGGIYLDTDILMLKPLTPFMDRHCVMGAEGYVDHAADQVGHRLRRALVRHAQQLDARHRGEHLGSELGHSVRPGIGDLLRIGLGERDQVGQRLVRRGGVHAHQLRQHAEEAQHFTSWNYCAIHSKGKQAAQPQQQTAQTTIVVPSPPQDTALAELSYEGDAGGPLAPRTMVLPWGGLGRPCDEAAAAAGRHRRGRRADLGEKSVDSRLAGGRELRAAHRPTI